jgi:shikimate dehydrogenase
MPPSPIDGYTQLVGLIGWPVEHSMSPAMHNAAFNALGLNWRYVPLPVAPGQVAAAVRGLSALGLRGANVTVPHKLAVMPTLDVVVPDARALGAVNTIVAERDKEGNVELSGHNTDAAGFTGALRESGFDPEGTAAVVVGAGGAARAVVFGLLEAGAGEVLVLNRTLERADDLVSDLGGSGTAPGKSPDRRPTLPPSAALQALPLTPDTLVECARAADLLVNATSVGMWPHVDNSIWPDDVPVPSGLTVFDLVYNPLETKLLRQARRSGARGVGGLGMLVHQGALSFEMWTGVEPPAEAMRTACERSLGS